MRRVFEIDVLCCPRCDATPMRILAAIHPPEATRAILSSLGLPTSGKFVIREVVELDVLVPEMKYATVWPADRHNFNRSGGGVGPLG